MRERIAQLEHMLFSVKTGRALPVTAAPETDRTNPEGFVEEPLSGFVSHDPMEIPPPGSHPYERRPGETEGEGARQSREEQGEGEPQGMAAVRAAMERT